MAQELNTRPESAVVASAGPAPPLPIESTEKPKNKESKSFFTYLRLLVYANPTWHDVGLLIVGTLMAAVSGVPFPLMGILFGQLVDDLNSATCAADANGTFYQSAVNDKVLKLVYIAIAQVVAVYIHLVCWSLIGERLAQRLRERYFASLLRQEASFFDNLPAGEVSSRLNGDINTIQAGTSEKVGICISAASFFITAYIIAFIKNAKLAGMLVSLVPAFMIMSLVGSYYIEKYSGKMSDHVASAASIASEGLSNIIVVQAFGANKRLETKFASSLLEAQKEGIKKAVATATQSGLLYFIAYAANALAFWQGSRAIARAVSGEDQSITVGSTYTVIFILVDASLMLSQVAPFLQIFGAAAAAFGKLDRDISHQSPIDGTLETVGEKPPHMAGRIDFKDVSFVYPSRPDNPVLHNISLSCPAGQHTAIIGLSGSGKSTIAGLTARLYDPTSGTVLVDNYDVRTLNVRYLRSQIALVQQEPSLLDRSILENIAHGLVNSPAHDHLRSVLLGGGLSEVASSIRKGLSMDDAASPHGPLVSEIVGLVRHAADLADTTKFISRLAQGFGTQVGSSGNLISGGQKQRIAVARALVKDPRILILDEATASLDSVSEQKIQGAIAKIAVGRTVISIAHRLSTIKSADNIIVMRNGHILEQGNHADLLNSNGAYAELLRLQNLSTREAQDDTSSTAGNSRTSLDSMAKESSAVKSSAIVAEDDEPDTTARPATESEENEEDEIEGLPSNRSAWSVFKSLAPMVRPYLLWLLVAFISAVVVGGSFSGEAVIFGNTVGALSPCNEPSTIRSKGNFFGLMFFILAIIEFFANLSSWSAFGWVAEKLLYIVRVLSFRSLFEQDLQWHQSEKRTPAVLLSFITKDGNALGGLTGSIIGTIFSILVNLIAAIVLTHIVAWRIALVCLVMVPILLFAGIMQMRVLAQFEERHEVAFAKSIGITVEAINSIKTVASLSLEHEVLETYRRSLQGPVKEVASKSAYANLWLSIAYSIANFIYALAYWWGAKQVIAGRYSQTQFFIVLLALLVSAQLWGQMFTLAPDVSKARAAIARILNLLDIGTTRDLSGKSAKASLRSSSEEGYDLEAVAEKATPLSSDSRPGVSVKFHNVEFSYPARPEIQVLRGMNIDIKPGLFCALVGPSGAGKSTVISLLERMYAPTSGSIEIESSDVAKRDGVAFREDIALVPQESVLFEGTVRFNVALGARSDRDATSVEVEEACRLANIHDTIMALPQGYDTHCGPNGSQLSGGQRQRLSIARALVRKPRLLLLDESTSALDAESEKLLQDGLERAARGITVIAIAHRLHTIKKADVIFLIEDGRCVDQGTHHELFGRNESYRVNVLHQTVE